jgi:hypothetical protein
MGADERVFAPQRQAFQQLIVPPWIQPLRGESLSGYAARFAQQIDPGGPCFVGGASFGGFVAIEMARHLADPRGVFLIGSCRSPAELPRRIRALRTIRGVARWMPFGAVCSVAGIGATALSIVPAPATRSLLRQLADTDARFLRWACRAVLEWEQSAAPAVPIHHIHGRCDHVLPATNTQADLIVDGAGHVLSLRRGREVNEFLGARINPTSGQASL